MKIFLVSPLLIIYVDKRGKKRLINGHCSINYWAAIIAIIHQAMSVAHGVTVVSCIS